MRLPRQKPRWALVWTWTHRGLGLSATCSLFWTSERVRTRKELWGKNPLKMQPSAHTRVLESSPQPTGRRGLREKLEGPPICSPQA